MTIHSVEVRLSNLANETLKTSYGSNVTQRQHIFVAITAEDGTTGYGEGSPLPHFSGERASEMQTLVREVFAPVLIGLDPFDVERAHQALERALPQHHASKAALINAIHDLQGRLTGLPAYAFLGGKVTNRIALGGAVGIEEETTVRDRVTKLWQQGIRTVKFKIGADIERDIRTIKMLRERFPAELEIRADANAGFGFSEAQRFLRAVADCRLQYLEQPLAPHDWKGLARLREFGTPIAADESLFGLQDALGLVAAEAVDVFIVKLIKLGGLHQARKVVGIAEAAGIACVAVSPYETALGAAANLHLAASSSAFPFAAELGVGISSVRLEGSGTIEVESGFATVPERPGLGIDLPRSLFERTPALAAI
ncbi:mandelate racemase/muconate lactonizing enzyme family protein [Devosia sp. 1635]|uniref:mandelate racemase/muconate lactonizing enzyme family protein n=1 Tax=Devosia sp. 1635 TaxID=2726066 RepID=UPI001565DE20|nr:mandelate racemase/muconate lactonizing enzyme family protein [Devosia sp. 1635]